VTCGADTIEVQGLGVRGRHLAEGGQPQRFTSQILPPYMCRAPKVAEVLLVFLPARVVDGRLSAGGGGACWVRMPRGY
jgi:hypothetical protein